MTDLIIPLAATVVAFGCFWAADKLAAISFEGRDYDQV
jgi:hypothetical protein